jgi:hypothetical protein
MTIAVKKSVDPTRVEREVLQAFQMLADSYGIKVPAGKLPRVYVKQSDTAFYNPKDNSITINPENVGDGIAYFEEASHALRDYAWRSKGVLANLLARKGEPDMMVQEFYGRAGETLGRHLVKGTDLEYLFKGVPERDLTSPETRKRWADRLRAHRKQNRFALDLGNRNASARAYLSDLTRKNQDEVFATLTQYNSGNLEFKDFGARLKQLEDSYRRGIGETTRQFPLSLGSLDVKQAKAYLSNFDFLRDAISIASGASDEERKIIMVRIANNLIESKDSPAFKFDLEDPEIEGLKFKTELGIVSHVSHSKPYLYAQQYSAPELLKIPSFYALADTDVREKFFRRLNPPVRRGSSALEKTLAAAFFILLPIFILFGVSSLTGFSIMNEKSSINNSLSSAISFIILIVSLLLLWIKNKQKTLF